MPAEITGRKRLNDYLYVLYKWKKFIIINLLIVIVLISVYAFMQPNLYTSTATVMIPPDNSISGLSGLLGGKSSAGGIGAKLLGIGGNTSEDMLMGLLNSRGSITNVIHKYNLAKYYEIEDGNIDKVIRVFRGDLNFSPNEFGMIEVNVTNKNPNLSAEIANYFVKLADSLSIYLNIQHAHSNKLFIEQRYNENLTILTAAEDSLYKFQKKYGIYELGAQLEVAFKAAAEIESQLASLEVQANLYKNTYSENSPEYQKVNSQINMLKNKVAELKKADQLSMESNVLLPFKKLPDISQQYFRIYRDMEVQKAILEVLLPLYEQSKIEEQKSIPTIMVVDKAISPKLKSAPRRSVIIGGVTMLGFFAFMILAFIGEGVLNKNTSSNVLDEKQRNFFLRIKKIYALRS
ncbi:MAG TPA: GNVR domain-containing protein [Ignavibacteriaceae bacterium]|nr:GNVR domain-containing protein [Ignavibacteriaceae bacterium]